MYQKNPTQNQKKKKQPSLKLESTISRQERVGLGKGKQQDRSHLRGGKQVLFREMREISTERVEEGYRDGKIQVI